jgi:hypothetical protein
MPGIEQMQLRVGQVTAIRLGAGDGEERVMPPPGDQRRRKVLAEEGLELRISATFVR